MTDDRDSNKSDSSESSFLTEDQLIQQLAQYVLRSLDEMKGDIEHLDPAEAYREKIRFKYAKSFPDFAFRFINGYRTLAKQIMKNQNH